MRAMLKTVGLPKTYWVEITKIVCYIINRSSSTTIEMKTSLEMWIGKPKNYSSLHIFGCPTYMMYNDQKRTKLDPKSKKCIFLGYLDGVKGYCLWDPTTHNVIINKDVTFVEDMLQSNEGDNKLMEKVDTISFIGN